MESKLQRKIISHLKRNGFIVNKVIRCNNPGWPDLEVLMNGQVVFIELKDKGKKTEPIQDYIHDILRSNQFKVFVVDTWEAYINLKLK